MSSYRDLQVWQEARERPIEIDLISVCCLYDFEKLETLHGTGFLAELEAYHFLYPRPDTLVRKLNNFIQSVERTHRSKPSP